MKNLVLVSVSLSSKLLTCGSVLMLVGCASGPSVKTAATEMKATEAQKVYLEGMTVLSENKLTLDKCTDPSMTKEKSWKVIVRNANACVKAQNWRGVEQHAQELARVEINSPWSAYFYSLAAERTGDLPRAVWMIDLAMKKSPGAGLFHYQKGRVFWQLKTYKDAVAEMTKAVSADSSLIDAHLFLAQAYHRDLNLDRAVTHYEAVLNSDSKQFMSLQGLADVRLQQGKPDKAVTLLNQAVAQQGSDMGLRLKLAQTSEQLEQFEVALTNYKAARDLARSGKNTPVGVDINEKIKALETKLAPRAPASVGKVGMK